MESLPSNLILEFKPDTLEMVRAGYNLDQKRMNEAIDRFEEWLAKQNHFVKKNYSRTYIEIALIQSKGSVEKAKTTTDKLCTLKTLLPKFFKNCDVKTEFKTVSQLAYLTPLPKMNKEYYRVYMIKLDAKEITPAYFMDFYRLNIHFFEYLKVNDYVRGFIVVCDCRDTNILDLMAKMNLVEFHQLVTILMEGYRVRISGVHVLTDSKAIDLLISTIKPILSPKVAGRVHVHTTLESLYNVVEKDILPVEYGGKEISIQELNKRWFELVGSEKHMEYMKEMNAACTDESLRSKDDFNKEYLGMPGTFRTLSVD